MLHLRIVVLSAIAGLLLLGAFSSRPAYGATYTVDTVSDASLTPCTGAANDCSLRGAITNANAPAAPDTIEFAALGSANPEIDVGSGSGGAGLPAITYPVTINGNTGGATRVYLNGVLSTGTADGLHISGGGSTIKGLVINQFDGDGIELTGGGGNIIQNNYIGTNTGGTAAGPGNGVYGINISESSNNTIGGTTSAQRNVISANSGPGVNIETAGSGSTDNVVQGNYIGTNAAGTAALGNVQL